MRVLVRFEQTAADEYDLTIFEDETQFFHWLREYSVEVKRIGAITGVIPLQTSPQDEVVKYEIRIVYDDRVLC